jgi:hypothetical protein
MKCETGWIDGGNGCKNFFKDCLLQSTLIIIGKA